MDGTFDFAFIMDTMKSEEALSVEPLIQEDIKMVTSSDHPLLAKSEGFPKDLIAGNTFTYRNGMLLSNVIGRRFSCSRRISIK
ncbi:MAG TPA: hypothetical protein VK105_06970 [Virgibacillus sp.]|nr:hypothetical protein [Virgibacillus sp.]HLR66865.1 hypothetical protein [Virgibacillus sp.]